MKQTWKNDENFSFKPNFVFQNFFFRGFYLYQLDIVPSNHPIKFERKIINQTWENFEKPNFGPNFGQFGRHLGH